jgi:hypothetical protein
MVSLQKFISQFQNSIDVEEGALEEKEKTNSSRILSEISLSLLYHAVDLKLFMLFFQLFHQREGSSHIRIGRQKSFPAKIDPF